MGRVAEKMLNRCYGKYRGRVIDNNDPLNRGRLQVEVRSLMSTTPFWALPCMPFGGDGMGIFMIPEKDTGVYVEFEGGDINYPIWTGCYWTDNQCPKDSKVAEPKVRLIKSEKGLTISLDDQDEVITISDKNGKNFISIEVTSGKIRISSESKIVLDSNNVKIGGEMAMYSNVKGEILEAYLTALALAVMPKAPTVPVPTPSMFASFLSTQVKTT